MDNEAERLRDDLTVEHLLAFARSVDPDAQVIAYRRNWWDGSAATGCLLVDMHGERKRVVNTGSGLPTLLPARALDARRALTEMRRAASEPLAAAGTVPARYVRLQRTAAAARAVVAARAEPRLSAPATVAATAGGAGRGAATRRVGPDEDYVLCRYADCGGLLPLADRGEFAGCPKCGRH